MTSPMIKPMSTHDTIVAYPLEAILSLRRRAVPRGLRSSAGARESRQIRTIGGTLTSRPNVFPGVRRRAQMSSTARTLALLLAGVAVALAATVVMVFARSSTPPRLRVDHIAGARLVAAELTPPAPRDAAAATAVGRAEQQFTVDLLKQSPSTTDNAALSPMSLAITLAMLQSGARGTTASEISAALHTASLSSAVQDAGWATLVSDLRADKGVTVESANGLWTQRGLRFDSSYLDVLARFFRAGVWTVDFAGNTNTAKRAINAWASKHTDGRITKLFDALDPSTVAVLANALYFKAEWQTQFDPANTARSTFHRGDDTSVPARFMTAQGKVSDHLAPSWQSAQVPFADGRYSALFVMPTQGSLADLLTRLDSHDLADFAATTDDPEASLSVPKFELSTYTELNDTLQRMGIQAMFGNADLHGMAPADVSVSQVAQRDYLKIDEHGAEAAAVTDSDLAGGAAGGPQLRPFDHPFLFMIRDTNTGAILFTGQINNPTAKP